MNASVDYVFPEKYRILSGSALKMIAVITMLIDHIGAVLLSISAGLLFPSSVFSCWKASGIHGAGSAMEEIFFFLHCSQKFRGI